MSYYSPVTLTEKFLVTLSYITLGIAGFIMLLLKGRQMSEFSRYHVFQSLMLALLFILFSQVLGFLGRLLLFLLSFSPAIQAYIVQFVPLLSEMMMICYAVLALYCIITLFQDKYSWIKWISPQVHKML